MGTSTYEEKYPLTVPSQVNNALGTDPFQMIASILGGAFRLDSLIATTDSELDLLLDVFVDSVFATPNAVYKLGTVTIPAGAGDGTVPSVDVLAALPTPVQAGFACGVGQGVYGKLGTAVASGKFLWLTAIGGEL